MSGSSPAPGTLIAGKYRVVQVLAEGGMGVVVDARHEALDQRVAVKLMLPEVAKKPEFVARFLREARAAARIRSDHVVRVSDVGTDEGDVPYMVMEFLEGRDLARELAARGRFPVGEAVDAVLEALEAVGEAHSMGIIHRDLKPSNLFVALKADGSKRIKVLDFGISKHGTGDGHDGAITTTKATLGSPSYMSPEQIRSTKGVDQRTDIWAMGVILYELLTGEIAFAGESLGDIFAMIREEDLAPITEKRRDCPPGLGEAVMRCLARDRERRFPDARSLRDALLPFASARFRMTLPAGSGGPPVAVAATSHDPGAATLAVETMDAPPSEAEAEEARPSALPARTEIDAPAVVDTPPRLGVVSTGRRRRRSRLVAVGSVLVLATGASALLWWNTRHDARAMDGLDAARSSSPAGATVTATSLAPEPAKVTVAPAETASSAGPVGSSAPPPSARPSAAPPIAKPPRDPALPIKPVAQATAKAAEPARPAPPKPADPAAARKFE